VDFDNTNPKARAFEIAVAGASLPQQYDAEFRNCPKRQYRHKGRIVRKAKYQLAYLWRPRMARTLSATFS